MAGSLAVVSTAVLLWFGSGLSPWWPLTWLAPLPVLILASRCPWRVAGLLPAGLAAALHLRRDESAKAIRLAALAAGAVVVAGLAGTIRLSRPLDGTSVKAGLVVSDGIAVADEGTPTTALLREYAARVEELVVRGAQVVVPPEKIGVAVGADAAVSRRVPR